MTKLFSKITIIGPGKVGTALGLALQKKGINIVSIVSRSVRSARVSAKTLHAKTYATEITSAQLDVELIIISAPAQILPKIVKELASIPSLDYSNIFIVHTSGAHSSRVLKSLAKKGAHIAAIHPIQTFPVSQGASESAKALKNIYYGIDAPKNSLPRAKSLVKLLGGKFVIIPEHLRPLYHALCVFSSGYIVQVLSSIEEISNHFNFPEPWHRILEPLLKTSINNAIKSSPSEAMTGPIMRGDIATIELHLKALKKLPPEMVDLYKCLGSATAQIARKKKLIGKANYLKLLKLLVV